MASDQWNPNQYLRFEQERRQPFDDLVQLVDPVPGGRAVDLGCGTGALTLDLHRALAARETIGIDSSPAMLAEARHIRAPGLSFRLDDAARLAEIGLDVVFANASLQWIPDHLALIPRLRAALAGGGQLAFQVPANFDHPSHVVAADLAATEPFAGRMTAPLPPAPGITVLAPEAYAELLDSLDAEAQHVRLQVYAHHLGGPEEVVEWVKGTALNRYREVLEPQDYQRFEARYRELLLARLGDRSPYFYAFKRILVWARFP